MRIQPHAILVFFAYCALPILLAMGAEPSVGWRDPTVLIRSQLVQNELRLTPEQSENCKKCSTRAQEARKSLYDGRVNLDEPPTPQERDELQRQMRKTTHNFEQDLDQILTPDQKRRFAELRLQLEGPTALLAKDIQLELSFTSEQLTEIDRIKRRSAKETGELLKARRDELDEEIHNPKVWNAKVEEVKRVARERLLGILTETQRARFDELKGEPFDWDALSRETPEKSVRGQ